MQRAWVASLLVLTFLPAQAARAADDLAPKLVATVPGIHFDPLVARGNGVLFMAGTPTASSRVWQSQGTASSTRSFLPEGPPRIEWLLAFRGSTILISSYSTLTAAANVVALDTHTRRASSVGRGISYLGAGTDSGLYFVDEELALQRTDGVPGRTRLVHPGTVPIEPGDPLTAIGKDLYFWTVDPGGASKTLNRARGTIVTPLRQFFGLTHGGSRVVALRDGRAVFILPKTSGTGENLWVTDGSAEGTTVIYDTPSFSFDVKPCRGQALLFTNTGVLATDGTPEGTESLGTIPPISVDGNFLPIGGDAGDACYFFTEFAGVIELWKTDLTPAGTAAIATLDERPVAAGGARGRLFFSTLSGKLWVSDGTAGTRVIGDGFGGLGPIVRAGDRMFFVNFKDFSTSDTELWRIDLPVGVSVEDAQVQEKRVGSTTLSFRVTLSRPAEAPVSVSYQTEDGTAGAPADFEARAGEVRFAVGERIKAIRVMVEGDLQAEGSETLRMRLSDPVGAEIERGLATGTIRDTTPRTPPRR